PKVGRREKGVAVKSQAVQAAIDRACKALEQLCRLHLRIPALVQQSGMRPNRAFFEFWLPILSGLSQQCYHPSREVRQSALTYLQRTLLSPHLETASANSPDIWVDCFENVLFPLLDELLKPEVFALDPAGMDETRMRACALLCKIFLQVLPRVVRWKELPRLWERILEVAGAYLLASETEYLYEGVQESLKNMILVMTTQGVLQPQPSSSTPVSAGGVHNLWDVTWQKIDTFLPGLRDELFPPDEGGEEGEGQKEQEKEEVGKEEEVRSVPVLETPVEGGSIISQLPAEEEETT
ncbi:GDP/GTP exchange factor for ARF, partial [Borealophlyctis nickersoniae]